MRNWCKQHPTQTVVEGATAFINEIRNNAAAPPPEGTGDGFSKPARDSLKKLIEKPAAR
jgi:membrane protein required for colicin V production